MIRKLDFQKEYILENDIVRLSPLKMEHANALLEIANEPDIWKYSFVKGDGIQNLKNYIQATLDNRTKGKDYPFVVFDKIQGAYAGATRFCEINPFLQSTRLGYTWYGEKFRGTGLNKNCKYLLFDFAFNTIGFERIGLGAYCQNTRSIAAMESVGCVKEGIYRGALPHPDKKGRTDAVLLSILKNEWNTSEKSKLKQKLVYKK